MRALRAARDGAARKAGAPAQSSLKSKLAKLGIRTDFDLVLHLPLRYEDETVLTPIDAARHGAPALVEGEVISSEVASGRAGSSWCRCATRAARSSRASSTSTRARRKSLAPGARVRLFGEVRPGFFGGEMVHPRYRVLRGREPLPESLTPVYPTTAGTRQALLRKLIDEALTPRRPRRHAARGDPRPANRLEPFAPSVLFLHRPPPDVDAAALDAAHAPGVAADEVRRAARAAALDADALPRPARAGARRRSHRAASSSARLLERLPFRLTRAQSRAWGEIERDLAAGHPMNRLLQGDVGSGKTIVAALAVRAGGRARAGRRR